MRLIAFYSTGSPYEDEARVLQASCDRLGLEHEIVGFKSRGDWYANTAAKAELIQQARSNLRDPLLYVDADAFVHVDPRPYLKQLDPDIDFGAHYYAGPDGGYNPSRCCACLVGEPCSQPHRILSGTLYFGDTPGALRLVNAWVAKNEELRAQGIVEGGGQKNLWRTLEEIGDALKIHRLPGRFTYVFDKPWSYPEGEPIWIEHSIASRENRPASERELGQLHSIRVNMGRRAKVDEWKQAVGL